MLKVKYQYSGKSFIISPYVTLQEKDLLLLSTVGEEDLSLALSICTDLDFSDFSNDEKLALLYKLREISVGSDVEVQFTCSFCSTSNQNSIDIQDIVKSSNITNPDITDRFTRVTDVNEFINVSGDLDYDEYDSLLKEVKDTVTQFDFSKPVACQKCQNINKIDISSPSFAISILSEDSLISLYRTYNDLIFHGKYTKQDVDSLYPFERTILMGLLNSTREDLNK